ncbi:hypothetical protein LOY37_13900 [Pseudomonas sp. B21-012]|uniref:hypothetical protein n=1 Tax=Pseudomonas sp. B21-012 TaxID=2895472 RepID=UPI002160043C|nr:hypothetical protein [Pseudomonas sp. B21-012]UVM53473.1 hypothetical protein LOY37_13900 [Pseudomonas sp. B21-012]
MQKIDIYLSRISQLVQVGLFITTLLTIYYTVIPLYKSAQLEESLARKEAEYESLSVKAKDILYKVNGWEYQQFVRIASECSGVPEVFLKDEKPSIGNRPAVEVDACLHTVLAKFKFTDLSSEKNTEIHARVASVRPVLFSIYKDYSNRFDEYPSKIDQDMKNGKTPRSSIDQLDQLVGDLGYRISDNQKRDSYVNSGRLEITYGYFSAVSDAIRATLGEKL